MTVADKKNTKKKKAVARGPRRGVSAGLGTAGKRRGVSALPKSKATNAYDLLSEVRELILEEPKRYNQGIYVSRRQAGVKSSVTYPSCGTIGCVAGWVTTLKTQERLTDEDVTEFAATVLGLGLDQKYQLFAGNVIAGRPQTRAYAERGARHIAEFQQEHAAQLKAKSVIA